MIGLPSPEFAGPWLPELPRYSAAGATTPLTRGHSTNHVSSVPPAGQRAVAPAADSGLGTLLPDVYDRLRHIAKAYMARERSGHTFGATELVHEAYVKLAEERSIRCDSPAHLRAMAAIAMTQILIDHARERGSIKRGGEGRSQSGVKVRFVSLDEAASKSENREPTSLAELAELAVAIQQLEAIEPRTAQGVRFRLFAGLEQDEIAEILGVKLRTVQQDWKFARGWLRTMLESHGT